MTAYRPFPINGLRIVPHTLGARRSTRIRSMLAALREDRQPAPAFVPALSSFTLEEYEAARAQSVPAAVAA